MVHINNEILLQLINEAKRNDPNEICGIFAGKNRTITKALSLKNISDKPELCYFIDPKEQLMAIKDIRAEGLELLGIYHSHPKSGAYPSKKDVELAFYPDAVYLIISLIQKDNPVVRAFRIVEGRISEEEVAS